MPFDDDADLRGDIEAALGDSEGSAQANPDPVIPETPESAPGSSAPEGEAPVRDSLGRFVPKAGKAETPQEPPEAAQTPAAAVAPTPTPIAQPGAAQAPAQAPPPPTSFGFGAREAWGQTPAAVQQEVARREVEMQRYVNDTAPARQLGETFYRTVQPYMAAIQAEGVDPVTAVDNLLKFGARMRMGTPAEKALTVANIVKAYGVSVEDLDKALVGEQPTQPNGADPQYVQQAVQQALQPLYQAAQQRQYQLAQQADGAARSELETFAADPKNRFFPDLRVAMADLIEVAKRQGYDMSLGDAYQRAGLLHPEISKVMMAERQGASAHQLTQAAQRAKAAAVSVKGTAPVGNPGGAEPSSIRESIEAAIESHSRI